MRDGLRGFVSVCVFFCVREKTLSRRLGATTSERERTIYYNASGSRLQEMKSRSTSRIILADSRRRNFLDRKGVAQMKFVLDCAVNTSSRRC